MQTAWVTAGVVNVQVRPNTDIHKHVRSSSCWSYASLVGEIELLICFLSLLPFKPHSLAGKNQLVGAQSGFYTNSTSYKGPARR